MELAELQQLAEAERVAQLRVSRVRCCTAAGCLSSRSGAVRDALSKAAAQSGLDGPAAGRSGRLHETLLRRATRPG